MHANRTRLVCGGAARIAGLARVARLARTASLVAGTITAVAAGAHAQEVPPSELHLLRLEGVPAGALPRMALPMPASRDNNYWGVRLQTGWRGGRGGGIDLPTIAAGVDLQYLGGSVFGVTAGYQGRDCELLGPDCGGHFLFGSRARFNFITGGSRIGEMIGDVSATTTVGAEVGVGYAPEVIPGSPACTVDIGVPVSLAMMQTVRLVAFATPGIIWDVDCGGEPVSGRATYLAAFGVGVQQLGLRGLDAQVGLQKLLRSGSGYQFGVSFTYTHLP